MLCSALDERSNEKIKNRQEQIFLPKAKCDSIEVIENIEGRPGGADRDGNSSLD